jgi:acid phosphatase (class A)
MKSLILLLLVLLSSTAYPQDLHYLTPESVDLSDIPAPPVMGSEADAVDLATVLKWQELRTEFECARAQHESHGYATSFFGVPYGPLTDEEAQSLVDFQERLFKEVNFFSRILKQRYSRVRPFNRHASIKPCITIHNSNGYPSGHAAAAYVASRTFSLIWPERARAFNRRAEEIALGRVIGGVHFPLDIEAGKILGERVFSALMESDEFEHDVRNFAP